jgi:hypothetical protein
MTDTTKDAILSALGAFIRQRPGLEPGNYISGWNDAEGRRMYRREAREIIRDLHDARTLLAAIDRSSVTGEALAAQLSHGRLTWNGAQIDYCTGQYFPTEYRTAACRALASALWYAWRDETIAKRGACNQEFIYKQARNYFGRGIAARWFR